MYYYSTELMITNYISETQNYYFDALNATIFYRSIFLNEEIFDQMNVQRPPPPKPPAMSQKQ